MHYEFLKSDEPFFITPKDIIRKKLELLELQDGEVLMDLGCGDASCLIMALEMAKVKGIGYEMREEAISKSKENLRRLHLTEEIEIIHQNFYEADISKADAIILYLTRFSLGRLSTKLEEELPLGSRIVTHEFDLPAWKAEKEVMIEYSSGKTEMLYFYRKTS